MVYQAIFPNFERSINIPDFMEFAMLRLHLPVQCLDSVPCEGFSQQIFFTQNLEMLERGMGDKGPLHSHAKSTRFVSHDTRHDVS